MEGVCVLGKAQTTFSAMCRGSTDVWVSEWPDMTENQIGRMNIEVHIIHISNIAHRGELNCGMGKKRGERF